MLEVLKFIFESQTHFWGLICLLFAAGLAAAMALAPLAGNRGGK